MKAKNIKYLGLILLCIWLFRPILFRVIGIDFSNVEYARNYRLIWIVLFPWAVIMITSNWQLIKDWTWRNYVKTGVVYMVSLVIISIVIFGSSLCENSFTGPIFKHVSEDRTLVYRSVDCGATSGSMDDYELVEIKYVGPFLTKYSYFDKTKEDMSQWK